VFKFLLNLLERISKALIISNPSSYSFPTFCPPSLTGPLGLWPSQPRRPPFPRRPKPSSRGPSGVTPTLSKKIKSCQHRSHIKCISICSTYEKPSKNKSCIGCIAWHGIFHFSKILEEPRRIWEKSSCQNSS
jgi:hypothetical protein